MSSIISTEYQFWKTEEENLLRGLTGSMSFKDMVKQYFPNRTIQSLQRKSTKLNLHGGFHPTIHSHDINFWKNPNPINSFFAGYIAADGNLSKSRYSLCVQTTRKDIKILKDLKDATQFTGDLAEYKGYPTLSVAGCAEWYKDLAEIWSITPAKTFTLQPPNIADDDLIKCFIIGFLCGDGWVSCREARQNVRVGFVGASELFMKWLVDSLNRLYPPHDRVGATACKPIQLKQVTDKNFFVCGFESIRALRILNDWRRFNVPFLSRKLVTPLIDELIEKYKQKYPHLFLDN